MLAHNIGILSNIEGNTPGDDSLNSWLKCRGPKAQPSPSPFPSSNVGFVKTDKTELGPPSTNGSIEGAPVKTIHIGGFFGKSYTVKKVGDKIVYERITSKPTFKPSATTQNKALEKSKNLSSSTVESLNKKRKKSVSFIICQQCGTQINPQQQIKCSTCGYKL